MGQTVATETDIASRLRLAVARLARRLRQQAGEPVTPSQISALATIERLAPLSMGDLAAAEGVQPPTMTRIVSALRDGGLVTSQTHPRDRRATLLTATAEGRRLLERSRRRKTAYLAARIGELPLHERDVLERAAAIMERIVEEGR